MARQNVRDRQVVRGKWTFMIVKRKINVAKEHLRSGETYYATGKRFGVQGNQVQRWVANLSRLEAMAQRAPRALTVHAGRESVDAALEAVCLQYVRDLRFQDMAVSTNMIVIKAKALDPDFCGGSQSALRWWMYRFLQRSNLSVRRATKVGQKLSGHLESVREDYVASMCERFDVGGTLHGTDVGAFVNMDEAAVFFESKVKSTVSEKVKRTVAVRSSGSNDARATVCLAAAADGTKLPLFIIFKGKPGATIERRLTDVIDERVVFAMQSRGWQNTSTMSAWIEKIWKPYIASTLSESSLLLLDEFKCHMQGAIGDDLADVGTELELIPGGYTCVLQPMDVGVNKPFKDGMRQRYMEWAAQNLSGSQRVPVPDRLTASTWIADVWDAIPEETIKKTFQKIGFIAGKKIRVPDEATVDTGDSENELVTLVEDVVDCSFGRMRIGGTAFCMQKQSAGKKSYVACLTAIPDEECSNHGSYNGANLFATAIEYDNVSWLKQRTAHFVVCARAHAASVGAAHNIDSRNLL